MANSEQPVQDQGPKKIVLGQGSIELSKQLIGCGGGVATAIITGIFLLIANSGILSRMIPATPTNTAAVASTTTALVSTATNAAISTPTQTVNAGSIGPITFAAGISGIYGTEPIETSTRFPQGITRVYAIFPMKTSRSTHHGDQR